MVSIIKIDKRDNTQFQINVFSSELMELFRFCFEAKILKQYFQLSIFLFLDNVTNNLLPYQPSKGCRVLSMLFSWTVLTVPAGFHKSVGLTLLLLLFLIDSNRC